MDCVFLAEDRDNRWRPVNSVIIHYVCLNDQPLSCTLRS